MLIMNTPKRSGAGDTLQQVLSVFKVFEKKLDKLQDDVNYQGQTLSDLKIMMTSLSSTCEPNMSMEEKHDFPKRSSKKTTAIQYGDRTHIEEPHKTKRKNVVQPFMNKVKAKSFQGQNKSGLHMSDANQMPFLKKLTSSPKPIKHFTRPLKAESPRKATTLRSQKNKMEKRRIKPKKQI